MQSWRRRIIGLLIFVTGLFLLLGGHYWVQSIRQNRALVRLYDLDGEITTYLTYPDWIPNWLRRWQSLPIGNEVSTVSLENSRLDNADLGFLKDLPHLWLLKLSGESVNDQVLLTLSDLDTLHMLELRHTGVSVEGLQRVLKMTPNLDTLLIHGTKMKDKDLTVLKTLPKRISVGLSGTQFTDASLERLEGFSNLTSLELTDTQITDAGLKHLLGLPNLRCLDLDGTSITPAGLEPLQKLPWLWLLSLRGVEIHDDDVQVLVGMKNLDYLFLEEGQLTSEGLLRLKSEMPRLRVTLLEPSK